MAYFESIIPNHRGSPSGQGTFEIVESPWPDIPPHTYGFRERAQHPLLNYWRILKKRKWTILATLIIVSTLAVITTLRMTPLYEAASRIAIYPENSNVLGLKDLENGGYAEDWDYNVALETQLSILRSDALALRVIEEMHLDQNPHFMGRSPQATEETGLSLPPETREPDPHRLVAMLGAFRGGLTAQVVPRTRVIEIRYIHSDPQLATDITNTLVRTFVEENFRTKYESTSQTADWLSKELLDLQLKVQTSEEKLVRYQKEKGIVGIDEKQNIVTTKLDELDKELTQAQTDRIQKEANYQLAQAGDPSAFAKLSSDSLLEKLRAQQADLENQYAQLTTQFGGSYPRVLEVRNQLKQVQSAAANEQKRLLGKIRDEFLAAAAREKLLASALESQKLQANELNQSAIEYTTLKRDADSNRELYQSLLQRLKEASVTAGLRSSNIRVVDVARPPLAPSQPNVPRNIEIGFVLGLLGGIGLAFLQESMDTTVGNLEELKTLATFPMLGMIPLELAGGRRRWLASGEGNDSERPGLITYARPKSKAAESYRALRTSLLLSSSGAPPKVILVTSALPQEGKTTVSTNSAMVLAQMGARVLLVDADMRRPGISEAMAVKQSRGLSTVLSGLDKV
ncbi:MAG: hypothetical protein JO356_09335, partial [Acidobacteria bacterium]|nr:hypothetical protein [Acidobacteriota bacterium]